MVEPDPPQNPWLLRYHAAEWIGGLVVGGIWLLVLHLTQLHPLTIFIGVLVAWFVVKVCWLFVRMVLAILTL
jgi:hypothetical protein